PDPPTGLSAVSGDRQVSLSWTGPSDDGGSTITKYRIYRGTNPSQITYPITVGNVYTYTDKYLINGQTYYYKVSAVNGAGEGSKSNETIATPVTVPSAPLDLVAIAGNGQISLSWLTPSSDGGLPIIGYKIYRGDNLDEVTPLTTLNASLTYTDTGLANGHTCYYKVSGVNSVGEGSESKGASTTPKGVPSAPQDLLVIAGDGQVILTWSEPGSDGGSQITNYKIYKGDTPDGETLLTTLSNVLIFIDTDLTNGKTYYYKVSAVNDVGEGSKSDTAATPLIDPDNEKDDVSWLWIIIGIIIISLILSLIVIMLMRKKKQEDTRLLYPSEPYHPQPMSYFQSQQFQQQLRCPGCGESFQIDAWYFPIEVQCPYCNLRGFFEG
ncbi:MAG: fibronectin type III domain-containing protein, partial [Methanomassiliicoccales archaeon]